MRKTLKKAFTVLFIMILCLTSFNYKSSETYAISSNHYLVLIQKKNGTWAEYNNMIEVSSRGNLMIKAKKIAKALGFTYKNKKETFVMKSDSRNNTYKKDKIEFTYSKGIINTKKWASNIAYESKLSNYNLCQVSTLSTLVHYKIFTDPGTKDYKGYKGIICYSKYNEVPSSIPEKASISTKKPTPTPIPEPKSIMIEGVEFPVRTSFLSVKKTLSDWGGTGILWMELEQKVDSSIIEATDLIVGSDKIEFTHLVAGSDGVELTKTSNGYKISISVKLSGSVLANQNASIVKAMVTTISSKPTLVNTAIFESFTTNQTHGINKKKYVKIGDCKIKIKIKDGTVSYLIKKA